MILVYYNCNSNKSTTSDLIDEITCFADKTTINYDPTDYNVKSASLYRSNFNTRKITKKDRLETMVHKNAMLNYLSQVIPRGLKIVQNQE